MSRLSFAIVLLSAAKQRYFGGYLSIGSFSAAKLRFQKATSSIRFAAKRFQEMAHALRSAG